MLYGASACPTFKHEDEQQEGNEKGSAEDSVARGCKSGIASALRRDGKNMIAFENTRASLLQDIQVILCCTRSSIGDKSVTSKRAY
ncbi:unnamed protein product [Lasius platythorax]|uniref:Uncharacterized protein n=1 Tax=Lasius platythorax TaxID=488582 RepID=A0AAV2P4Z9_9HYME